MARIRRDRLVSTEANIACVEDNEGQTNARDHVDAIIDEWQRERPDLDTSPMALVGRLHRVAHALERELDAVFSRFHLSRGEYDVLATLRRAGEPYERAAGELAEHVMITSGGLTKRIDRLQARDLLVRNVGETDARRRTVALTPQGRALVDQVTSAHLDNERRLVGMLDAGDAARTARTLKAWLRALGES